MTNRIRSRTCDASKRRTTYPVERRIADRRRIRRDSRRELRFGVPIVTREPGSTEYRVAFSFSLFPFPLFPFPFSFASTKLSALVAAFAGSIAAAGCDYRLLTRHLRVLARAHTRLVPAAILDYTITLYFQKGPRMQNSLTQPRPLTSDSIIQFSPSTFSPESPAGSRRWLNRRSRSLKPFTFVHGETEGGGRGLPRKRALARCVARSRNSLNRIQETLAPVATCAQ